MHPRVAKLITSVILAPTTLLPQLIADKYPEDTNFSVLVLSLSVGVYPMLILLILFSLIGWWSLLYVIYWLGSCFVRLPP